MSRWTPDVVYRAGASCGVSGEAAHHGIAPARKGHDGGQGAIVSRYDQGHQGCTDALLLERIG